MKIGQLSLSSKIEALYPSESGAAPGVGSCENCGKEKKKYNLRFCSLSCANSWSGRAKAWPIGYCKTCEKAFSKKKNAQKIFCGHSCAASHNNLGKKRYKINPNKIQLIKLEFCLQCGEPTKENATKYCSHKCQQQFQRDRFLEEWLFKDAKKANSKAGLSPVIRNLLLEIHNYSCSSCGWNKINQYTKKSPLEIDHINGIHTDNRLDNLRVLCPNCHALTSTYKALNFGNGRKWRNKAK